MQVQELLELLNWFEMNILGRQIPEKYDALYRKMQTNVRRQNGQQLQPFASEKADLYESLSKITYDELTFEQIDFLNKLNVANLFTPAATKMIDADLTNSSLDLSTAAQVISNYSEKLKSGTNTILQLKSLLGAYFTFESNEVHDNEILMRIYFQNDVSINNVADLKKLSNIWFDISRGIAMASGQSPEDFRVIGAKKGSIIIDMAVAVGLATTVGKILLEGLKVADKVLDIRKKAEEIKALKLQNKKIEQELEKAANSEKEEGITKIVEETIKQLNLKPDSDGEAVTGIEKSIRKLVDFTEKGGQVDFVNSNNSDEEIDDNRILLRTTISEIRHLEKKISLLEITSQT